MKDVLINSTYYLTQGNYVGSFYLGSLKYIRTIDDSDLEMTRLLGSFQAIYKSLLLLVEQIQA